MEHSILQRIAKEAGLVGDGVIIRFLCELMAHCVLREKGNPTPLQMKQTYDSAHTILQ